MTRKSKELSVRKRETLTRVATLVNSTPAADKISTLRPTPNNYQS